MYRGKEEFPWSFKGILSVLKVKFKEFLKVGKNKQPCQKKNYMKLINTRLILIEFHIFATFREN